VIPAGAAKRSDDRVVGSLTVGVAVKHRSRDVIDGEFMIAFVAFWAHSRTAAAQKRASARRLS
jgi:hypothetical protein